MRHAALDLPQSVNDLFVREVLFQASSFGQKNRSGSRNPNTLGVQFLGYVSAETLKPCSSQHLINRLSCPHGYRCSRIRH